MGEIVTLNSWNESTPFCYKSQVPFCLLRKYINLTKFYFILKKNLGWFQIEKLGKWIRLYNVIRTFPMKGLLLV